MAPNQCVAIYTMQRMTKKHRTNTERVAESRAKLLKEGGAKIPFGYLQPTAAAALKTLIESGYASTATGAISAALIDASRKVQR